MGLSLPERLPALAPWLAAGRGAADALALAALELELARGPGVVGAPVVGGDAQRLLHVAAWAARLPGWRVWLVPVARALGTALERDHLVLVHQALAEALDEPAAPPQHPNALRDAVAEQLQLGEPAGDERVLLIVDGLDEALDGVPERWLGAAARSADARSRAPNLHVLLTGRDATRIAQLAERMAGPLQLPADADAVAPRAAAAMLPILTALHGPIERRTLDEAFSGLAALPPYPRLVEDGDRVGVFADPTLDGASRAAAERAVAVRARDELGRWRGSGLGPLAYFVRHMRSHLVETWHDSGEPAERHAIGDDLLSLASVAWADRWSREARGQAAFAADIWAVRSTVASTRRIADEVRCALLEAGAFDPTPAATAEARALVAVASATSATARERLLQWAEARLLAAATGARPDDAATIAPASHESTVIAWLELARAADGARRQRAAEAGLQALRDEEAPTVDAAERLLELATLAGDHAYPRAIAACDALATDDRGAALERAPLSLALARSLSQRWAADMPAAIDVHAQLLRAQGDTAAQDLAVLAERWLQRVERGEVDAALERAGRVVVPELGLEQLARLQLVLPASGLLATALGSVIAARLAELGRIDDAEGWSASLADPWRHDARLRVLHALPASHRAAAADRQLQAALQLPLNVAIAIAAPLLAFVPLAARARAAGELARRFLDAPDTHTEIGFDLAVAEMAAAGDAARHVFSRLLDWLVDGSPTMSRARLLCGDDRDLRRLVPLIAGLEGDEGLLEVGQTVAGVALGK